MLVLNNKDTKRIGAGLFAVPFFSVVLILSWCLASTEDDYFNRITMVSDGRITRFSINPVTVYIAAPSVTMSSQIIYVESAEYALNQWAGCSEGQLQFKRVNSEDADIRIYWVREQLSGEADPLGEASLVRLESGKFYVKISILIREMPMLRPQLRSIIMHELGHAIGLWGHSRDRNDVMYHKSTAIYPTRRDKNTLLKLLSSPPDAPFHRDAIAELKSDISENPDAAHLHFWLGAVYADEEKDSSAIKELMTALKLSPNLIKAADRLGRIFQKEGMYEKAIAYYSKEAKLEPSPGLYGIIGMLHFRQGKYEEAIEYFEKALNIDNNFTAARTNTLAAYHQWVLELIKSDRSDKAISVLSRAMELFPDSRVVHYDLGTAYDASGLYEKAIEQYKKALEIDPAFTAAKRNIAACMNNMGAEQIRDKNWEISIRFCEQALEWDPDCWEARKNLESATFGLGRKKQEAGLPDEAIIHYNAVLDMNPNNLDAYNALGNVFYEKGMYKEALKRFQTVLNAESNNYDAIAGMAMVRQHINAGRAKLVISLTCASMILCTSAIFLYRHFRRRKSSANREVQSEQEGVKYG